MLRTTKACVRWCKYMTALFTITFIITAGFMTRKNDLWIMNSLAFDNVVAIQESRFVSVSIFQVNTSGQDVGNQLTNSETESHSYEVKYDGSENKTAEMVGDLKPFIDDAQDTGIFVDEVNNSDLSHLDEDPLLWGSDKNESSVDIMNEIQRKLNMKNETLDFAEMINLIEKYDAKHNVTMNDL